MDREKIMALVQPHLANGEQPRAIALGVTPLPRWVGLTPMVPLWILLIAFWTNLWPRQWNFLISVLVALLLGLVLTFIASKLLKAARFLVVATGSRFHLIEIEGRKPSEKAYAVWDLAAVRRGTVVQNKIGVTLHFYPPEGQLALVFPKAGSIVGNDALALKIDQILRDPNAAAETAAGDPFTAIVQTHTPIGAAASPANLPEGSAFLVSDGRGWRCSACQEYLRPDATFCKHCKKPIATPSLR